MQCSTYLEVSEREKLIRLTKVSGKLWYEEGKENSKDEIFVVQIVYETAVMVCIARVTSSSSLSTSDSQVFHSDPCSRVVLLVVRRPSELRFTARLLGTDVTNSVHCRLDMPGSLQRQDHAISS